MRSDGELGAAIGAGGDAASGSGATGRNGEKRRSRSAEERRHTEMLLLEQNKLLERIATGASLDECLVAVTEAVSRLQPRTRACILLADEPRLRFETSFSAEVSPSFGLALKDAPINDLAIGTCGAAAFRAKHVICRDIAEDERWSKPWRELCLAHGVRACFSLPVSGADGLPLASLMLCFEEPREPTDWEYEIARFGAHVASIAIERDRSLRALRESERKSRELLDALPVAIYTTDAAGRITYYNEAAAALSGRRPELGKDEWSVSWRLYRPDGTPLPHDECAMAMALKENRAIKGAEAVAERPDGTRVPFTPHPIPLRDESGALVGAVNTLVDIRDRKQAEQALRDSEARYRRIVESANEYAIVTLDEDGLITSWNEGAERLLGYSEPEAIGRSRDIFFTPEDRAAGQPEEQMRRVRSEGRAVNERWHVRKDGSRFWGSGFLLPVAQAGHGGYVKIFRDRTEEQRAEERQSLLIDELNHRVKNTLAIVQALAQQTFRGQQVPIEVRRAFEGRLEALAGAHNLLTRRKWEAADLVDIVRDSVHAHGTPDRFAIDGPSVNLEPRTAVTVAMALHELCTNATKYGALSVDRGQVSVAWEVAHGAEPKLLLRWEESGGPSVSPPARRGFGSRMVERALASELRGEVRLDFRPEGLIFQMEAPLPRGAT